MHVAHHSQKGFGSRSRTPRLPQWRLVIVIDGDPPASGWGALVGPDATVIAADGGARHANAEGIRVTELIGDLDSLGGDEIDALIRGGTTVHRFDPAKDFTDFELAAQLADRAVHDSAIESDPRVLVVGGTGGRLDHELGNIAVLGGADLARFEVTALMGESVVHVATPDRGAYVVGDRGTLVSLVPVGGPALGVRTTGLRFRLDGDDLCAGATRGISNVVEADDAHVSVAGGSLLVIEPEYARGSSVAGRRGQR